MICKTYPLHTLEGSYKYKYKYIYTTFPEIKPLYQYLIKQSLRKPTILMINFINLVGFNYSVSLLCWHFISQKICNLSLCGMYRQPL